MNGSHSENPINGATKRDGGVRPTLPDTASPLGVPPSGGLPFRITNHESRITNHESQTPCHPQFNTLRSLRFLCSSSLFRFRSRSVREPFAFFHLLLRYSTLFCLGEGGHPNVSRSSHYLRGTLRPRRPIVTFTSRKRSPSTIIDHWRGRNRYCRLVSRILSSTSNRGERRGKPFQLKQNALSTTALPARGQTATGGRICSTSICCTSTPPSPTRWARTSTTQKSSRAWTWPR